MINIRSQVCVVKPYSLFLFPPRARSRACFCLAVAGGLHRQCSVMSKIGVDFGGTRIKLARVEEDRVLGEASELLTKPEILSRGVDGSIGKNLVVGRLAGLSVSR